MKTRNILSKVSQMGPDGYNKFKIYLEMSDQKHLANLLSNTEQALEDELRMNKPSQKPKLANTPQGENSICYCHFASPKTSL